jgi:hypothetical protein
MKIQSQENITHSSSNSDGEVIPFTVDPFAAVLLQANMYSNKIQTPVQEYLLNALDSHRVSGKDTTPFRVGLPTKMEPIFSVRDFGPGLSRQDIVECFSVLGKSTKRHSSKFAGGYGIGGKSGFAYTDSFNVISFYNGVKSTYVAYRSTENPSGGMKKTREESTTEPNGLEIQIPLKSSSDIPAFIAAVYRAVFLWPTKPILTGILAHETPSYIIDTVMQDCEFRGDDWAYVDNKVIGAVTGICDYNQNIKICLAVDGIPYLCPTELQNQTKIADDAQPDTMISLLRKIAVKDKTLVLFFAVNEIEIATSKEAVERTDKTAKAVLARMVQVRTELYDQVHKKLMVGDTTDRIRTLFNFSDRVPSESIDGIISDKDFSIGGFRFKRNDKSFKVFGDIITKNFEVVNLTLNTTRRKTTRLKDEFADGITVPRNTSESAIPEQTKGKIWNLLVVERDCDVSATAFREKLKMKLSESHVQFATIVKAKSTGSVDEIQRVRELFSPIALSSLPRPVKATRQRRDSKVVIVHEVKPTGQGALASVHLEEKHDGPIMVIQKEKYDEKRLDAKDGATFMEMIQFLRDRCGYKVLIVSLRGMKGLDVLGQRYSTLDEAEQIIRDYCDTTPEMYAQMAYSVVCRASRDIDDVIEALNKKKEHIADNDMVQTLTALCSAKKSAITVPSAALLHRYYPNYNKKMQGFDALTSTGAMMARYPLLANISLANYYHTKEQIAKTIDELLVYINMKVKNEA